ncbi:hypothetical protein Heal19_501679 [Lactiplantibacillus plantarum]|nr:hypothetical protein Heal19_501679 [Lactiplantibacillus plantarum]
MWFQLLSYLTHKYYNANAFIFANFLKINYFLKNLNIIIT